MKKWIFPVLLLSSVWANAFEVLAEATVAYFQPIGGRFEEIYGGAGIYGGELTFPVN